MRRHSVICGAALWLLATPAFVLSADVKPVRGTLFLGGTTYHLAHVAAYESKPDGEMLVNILVSDRRLPLGEIKTALAEGKGNDDSLSLSQPYVKLVFGKSGKLAYCKGWADNSSFSTSGGDVKAEYKLENGRIRGNAKLALQGEGAFKKSFDFQFDAPLGADQAPKPAARPAGPVKPTITGTFNGNGQPSKLAFVSARQGEPFADKPSVVLIFSEKDHTKDPRADSRAAFGDYGSALIISLHEDGRIFGCEVSHAAHARKPFSSVGTIKTSDFDVGDGQISGRITTDGKQDFFGQTWEVDIKFAAPFVSAIARPAAPAVATESPAKKSKKSKKHSSDAPSVAKTDAPPAAGQPAAPAGAMLNVYDLALPKNTADFEYKKLVEHLKFNSGLGIEEFVGELSKSLAGQGWASDGDDLVTAKSAILKRTRGTASLTIFVHPTPQGSKVSVMSEGLDWKEKAKK